MHVHIATSKSSLGIFTSLFTWLLNCCMYIVGSHYVIKVSACARGLGTFHVPLAFHFRRSSGREFHIIRFLNAKCVSDITEELKPTAPYRPPTRVAEYRESVETVPGVKPPKYVCLFVYILFKILLEIFHLVGRATIAGERLQTFGFCSALLALQQGGVFIVPHLLWYGVWVLSLIWRTAVLNSHFVQQANSTEDVFLIGRNVMPWWSYSLGLFFMMHAVFFCLYLRSYCTKKGCKIFIEYI